MLQLHLVAVYIVARGGKLKNIVQFITAKMGLRRVLSKRL